MSLNNKKKSIKVSVVVPVYNESKYLVRSLDSLKNQKYTNIEIILVNDGSTDNSLEILKKYEEEDNRFIVVNKSNGGLVDATITGIKFVTGDYTCFLDPDDYVGLDFIENYIKLIKKYGQLDFFATGFYKDDNGTHYPYSLQKNSLLNYKEIQKLKENFLYDGKNIISNNIFISRWNKIYRTNVVKKIIKKFYLFKDVSLGEDTIYTCIMLNICRNGLATTFINSYYYNIGNQNSMMNNTGLIDHMKKAYVAYSKLKELLYQTNQKTEQAYILYYDLMQSLIMRTKRDNKLGTNLFKQLKEDTVYSKAVNILLAGNVSIKLKYTLKLYKYSNNYFLYSLVKNNVTTLLRKTKRNLNKGKFLIKNVKKNGLIKGYRDLLSFNKRMNAFEDLNNKLPMLEKRISPFIKKYINQSTNLEETTIAKNIFIFWWDGLSTAPDIVKACVNSVYRNYPDYKVIIITKNNFQKYSKINKYIIRDFKAGKISIQTFSDILRFNLLYLNGGIWADATIFFERKFDLLKGLKDKSFESLCFNTSEDFLKYKNLKCSWSGFLIASRKQGLFVQVMNDIFEEYYIKYHTYSIYFFIDAAFMITKMYGIDNHVLDKVQKSNENMFDLVKILNLEFYEEEFKDNTKIPQKLSWLTKVDKDAPYRTNYDHMLEKYNL